MSELYVQPSSNSVPDMFSQSLQDSYLADAYSHAIADAGDDDDLFPYQQECDTLALADALQPAIEPDSPFQVGSPFSNAQQVSFDDTPCEMALDPLGSPRMDLMEAHLSQTPKHSALELALSRSLEHDHELQPCASLKRAFSAGDIQEVLQQQQAAEAAAGTSATAPLLGSPRPRPHQHHHRSGLPKTRSMFDVKKFAMHPGVRKWLKIDASGDCSMVQIDKSRISARLGVQWRDLRIVDPKLATNYPSAILCRDKAMVINLEYIKAIITTGYVLVSNLEHEHVLPFVEELKRKLSAPPLEGMLEPSDMGMGKSPGATAGTVAGSSVGLHVRGGPAGPGPGSKGGAPVIGGSDKGGTPLAQIVMTSDLELPFELRCLEACLEHICGYWERQVRDLDTEAGWALKDLTGKVNTEHLEKLWLQKARLNRYTTKVETIREVLEKLLDDDKDMLAMNLSAKEALEAAALARQPSMEVAPLGLSGPRSPLPLLRLPTPRRSHTRTMGSSTTSSSSSGSSRDSEEEQEIAEVEMLLEAYFMQVDNTYNKLQALKEYIDDTEDLINTELDFNFNQLIEVDLLLTCGTFAVTVVSVMGAIFGMNLAHTGDESHSAFLAVTLSTTLVAILLFCSFYLACKYKQIIVNI